MPTLTTLAGADPGFLQGMVRQHTILPKNYTKLTKFWTVGGRTPGMAPRSANGWSFGKIIEIHQGFTLCIL